jgi:DNA-binding MltR family transcriptional regulator
MIGDNGEEIALAKKRDPLKQISKHLPDRPEIDRILDGFRGGSDMSVAITASAIVEARLEQLLTSRLKTTDQALINSLYQDRGPLSGFYAKTAMAEAMGVINPALARELHHLRDIRNAFAHSKVPLTFAHDAVAPAVWKFGLLNMLKNGDAETEPLFATDIQEKDAMLFMTKLIMIMLDALAIDPNDNDAGLARFFNAASPSGANEEKASSQSAAN